MKLFDRLSGLGYGELHFGRDAATGLQTVVALHSTRLGPGIGGCRIRPYPSEDDAIEDALRLARAMTYKAAIARLPHGGGKAVILAPADLASWDRPRRDRLFASFGQVVDGLGGRYVTTEDSGTSAVDMDAIRTTTSHVLGASQGSGDPSPFTALGVRRGIEAIAHQILERSTLEGLHVAIQGVGHVGGHLARELARAGARLTVSDVDPARAQSIAKEVGAAVVPSESILETQCDLLAPCALGGPLTEDLVPRLRTRAVGGAANNQLATAATGRLLAERGIFYAPDYAINGGGLINVATEFAGYDADKARSQTLAIYDTIAEIITRARRTGTQPELVADAMAQEIIEAGPAPRQKSAAPRSAALPSASLHP